MNRKELRADVEAAALREAERVGPEGFRPEAIVRQFSAHGVDRATLYRWIAALRASGRMGAYLAARVRTAAQTRAACSEAPSEEVARDAATLLPQPMRSEEIAAAGGLVSFTGLLQCCVHTAEQLLRQATAPDGSIRMPRLALSASEHLRRCLETSARVAVAMRDLQNLQRFHAAVIDAVRAENPEAAERLLARLMQITEAFADDG